MAGLVDMHAHEEDLLGYHHLAAGVTTVRDMGNDNARLLETHSAASAPARPDGPRIVRAGLLEGKSPYLGERRHRGRQPRSRRWTRSTGTPAAVIPTSRPTTRPNPALDRAAGRRGATGSA